MTEQNSAATAPAPSPAVDLAALQSIMAVLIKAVHDVQAQLNAALEAQAAAEQAKPAAPVEDKTATRVNPTLHAPAPEATVATAPIDQTETPVAHTASTKEHTDQAWVDALLKDDATTAPVDQTETPVAHKASTEDREITELDWIIRAGLTVIGLGGAALSGYISIAAFATLYLYEKPEVRRTLAKDAKKMLAKVSMMKMFSAAKQKITNANQARKAHAAEQAARKAAEQADQDELENVEPTTSKLSNVRGFVSQYKAPIISIAVGAATGGAVWAYSGQALAATVGLVKMAGLGIPAALTSGSLIWGIGAPVVAGFVAMGISDIIAHKIANRNTTKSPKAEKPPKASKAPKAEGSSSGMFKKFVISTVALGVVGASAFTAYRWVNSNNEPKLTIKANHPTVQKQVVDKAAPSEEVAVAKNNAPEIQTTDTPALLDLHTAPLVETKADAAPVIKANTKPGTKGTATHAKKSTGKKNKNPVGKKAAAKIAKATAAKRDNTTITKLAPTVAPSVTAPIDNAPQIADNYPADPMANDVNPKKKESSLFANVAVNTVNPDLQAPAKEVKADKKVEAKKDAPKEKAVNPAVTSAEKIPTTSWLSRLYPNEPTESPITRAWNSAKSFFTPAPKKAEAETPAIKKAEASEPAIKAKASTAGSGYQDFVTRPNTKSPEGTTLRL